MSYSAIEQEIQDKGLTAPRVTPADVTMNIQAEYYFSAEQGVLGRAACSQDSETKVSDVPVPFDPCLRLLTLCVLVLQNGFTVTGESACASPENFDAEMGRKIARQNAEQKIWPLMGYELKQRLHDAVVSPSRADEEFQHFLSYSGLSSQSGEVLEKLRLAFDAGR